MQHNKQDQLQPTAFMTDSMQGLLCHLILKSLMHKYIF